MRWPVKIYRVTGDSMEPAYRNGVLLLGSRWLTPKIGRAVVVDPHGYTHDVEHTSSPRNHIKRVKYIDGNGIWVEGDNATASTDSRQYGYVRSKNIEAVVLRKII